MSTDNKEKPNDGGTLAGHVEEVTPVCIEGEDPEVAPPSAPDETEKEPMARGFAAYRRLIFVVLGVVAFFGLLLLVLWLTGTLRFFLQPELMRETLAGLGLWAPLIFSLLQCGQVILTVVPGAITTMAGGAFFGAGPGFLYSYVGVITGSCIVFWLARRYGQRLVRRMVGPMVHQKYESFVTAEGALTRTRVFLLVAMVLPLFPDDLICLMAGLSPLPFWQFLLIIGIGRVWGLLVSALVGSGLHVSWWVPAAVALVFVVLGVLAIRYARRLEQFILRQIQKIRPDRKK